MKTITKIVLTGGPCAGKSTALDRIKQLFTDKGYKVIFVSETASDMILGGIAFGSIPKVDFQSVLLAFQLCREKGFEHCARKLPDEKILIVCDRGAMDGKAYMDNDEWTEVLSRQGTSETELMGMYDAIFHMVSAADGAADGYTTADNNARTEDAELAIVLDKQLIKAWTGHPHLRIIDNSTGFEEKLCRLTQEIEHFLKGADHVNSNPSH